VAYEKQNFANGNVLTAEQLNHIEEGIAANELRFWNDFQQNGERTDYKRAFVGDGWNAVTYDPKYILKPVNASFMYQNSGVVGRVDVDTSNCTAMDGLFGNAKSITSIGTIDTRKNANKMQAGLFGYMDNLENIDMLILEEDGSQTFSTSCFTGCNKLKEIRITGTIGNTLLLESCFRLTRASIESIIGALSDDAEGQTLSLAYAAKRDAFKGEDGEAAWQALIATKPKWNITGGEAPQ
jgi:hypothetical protein